MKSAAENISIAFVSVGTGFGEDVAGVTIFDVLERKEVATGVGDDHAEALREALRDMPELAAILRGATDTEEDF